MMDGILPPEPPSTEIAIADGIFVKTMVLPKAGMTVAQHAHVYDHVTALVSGSVRLYKDGEFDGDYVAPFGFVIPANAKHLFQALEDGTKLLCIHDVATAEGVLVAEEHKPGETG